MTWNVKEAETWLTKFALLLNQNGDVQNSNNILCDIVFHNCCQSEELFKQTLRNNTSLNEVYIEWALKEVRHDG